MDRRVRNITKDWHKRKSYLKNELKYILLKSIISNKNTKPIVRAFCHLTLTKFKKIHRISFQGAPCLTTGRYGGNYKYTQQSRHAMIKLGTSGHLTNFRISS
jgi:hypothetical protein